MKTFKADLHIHTILSPCASLEMSPVNIVHTALDRGLDIIGITDHNSTRQCGIVMKEAEHAGLKVYPGVEITTREEIHCLAYFRTLDDAEQFQEYLDEQLPFVKNDPALFGYQVVVDEQENIVYEEQRLLITALHSGIDHIETVVHQLNGVFIPAHVNKSKDSIISQLGFIPDNLNADAFEITPNTKTDVFLKHNRLPEKAQLIKNSDSHSLGTIGENVSHYEMESTDFSEFCFALKNISGRKVVTQ